MSYVEWHTGRRSAAIIRAERLQAAQSRAQHTLVTDSETRADSIIMKSSPKPKKASCFGIACFASAPSSPIRPFHSQSASAAGGEENSLLDHDWCHQHQTAFEVQPESAPISCTLACLEGASPGPDQPSIIQSREQRYSLDSVVDESLPAVHQTGFDVEPQIPATSASANIQEVEGQNQDSNNITHQVCILVLHQCMYVQFVSDLNLWMTSVV